MKKSIIILCLSVGLLNAKFVRDNTKEVVLDTQSNLIWQDNNESATLSKNWNDAIIYCEALNLGGYDDWHLPNFNELYYLATRDKITPAMESGFVNVVSTLYWSSTSYAVYNGNAWNIDFNDGLDGNNGKSSSYHVRCVREQ